MSEATNSLFDGNLTAALEGADPNATWGGGALRWWAAERFVMSAEWRWCWFRSSVRSITIV